MSQPIPGMADRIRKAAISKLGHKKYVYRSKELHEVISNLSDDDIYAFGPNDLIDRIADAYPKRTDPWEVWAKYQRLIEDTITTPIVNTWCNDVIELALRRKAQAA